MSCFRIVNYTINIFYQSLSYHDLYWWQWSINNNLHEDWAKEEEEEEECLVMLGRQNVSINIERTQWNVIDSIFLVWLACSILSFSWHWVHFILEIDSSSSLLLLCKSLPRLSWNFNRILTMNDGNLLSFYDEREEKKMERFPLDLYNLSWKSLSLHYWQYALMFYIKFHCDIYGWYKSDLLVLMIDMN